jgi:F0F1-type ATP synthase assembly protein I
MERPMSVPKDEHQMPLKSKDEPLDKRISRIRKECKHRLKALQDEAGSSGVKRSRKKDLLAVLLMSLFIEDLCGAILF